VPATIDLAGAEIELVNLEQRESRLRAAVRTLVDEAGEGEDRPDYVSSTARHRWACSR
jgi:chromosome partitioning protein